MSVNGRNACDCQMLKGPEMKANKSTTMTTKRRNKNNNRVWYKKYAIFALIPSGNEDNDSWRWKVKREKETIQNNETENWLKTNSYKYLLIYLV